MPLPLTSADVYTDLQGLEKLRAGVSQGQPSAEQLRQVAGQFEALFTQMMLKSMRAASFGDELFGSEQEDFYRDMYDKQLSLMLSKGQGMGLSEMLFKQLGGDRLPSLGSANSGAPARAPDAAAFVRTLLPAAQQAARQLGVAPDVLLAQAANETGWGRAVARRPDGRSSFNLFGIKADAGWQGGRVDATTLEYQQGVLVRKTQAFRAYDSYAASFADYVDFLRSNPRYQEALANAADPAAYTRALQDAGYATDPDYAAKLQSILSGPLLRQALAGLKNPGTSPLTG
jgi:flagellar protein FlgJ